MSRISQAKKERIQEEIIRVLFEAGLKGLFTKQIADEIARKDEFVLTLLSDLEKKQLVTRRPKRHTGSPFVRRKLWTLTEQAHKAYQALL